MFIEAGTGCIARSKKVSENLKVAAVAALSTPSQFFNPLRAMLTKWVRYTEGMPGYLLECVSQFFPWNLKGLKTKIK